uniref:KIB1-4 beta-propeller domain-containing protein n=1 Tax=Aegilops tauschii TaxID=37682 RepID=M8AVA5_AEGTA
MVIMMHHRFQGSNRIVFCRPGDTAWTMIGDPNSDTRFSDFAYFDGKMFAMDNNCVTLVFDAMTLKFLYQIGVPPETLNFGFKLCGGSNREEFECLHLVALPHKLLLVKLGSGSEDDEGLAWCRVTTDEGVGGNYEIFMDSYHATYSNSGDGRGTRIYHADNERFGSASCVWGHCYNMQDNKVKHIYQPPQDDYNEYSTKPSWFVQP